MSVEGLEQWRRVHCRMRHVWMSGWHALYSWIVVFWGAVTAETMGLVCCYFDGLAGIEKATTEGYFVQGHTFLLLNGAVVV